MIPEDGGTGRTGITSASPRRSPDLAVLPVDEVLSSLDQRARVVTDEREFFRDVLRILLSAGAFTAIRVWSVDATGANCEASAPESAPHNTPPIDLLTRIALDSGSETLSLPAAEHEARGAHPLVVAGFRVLDREGVVIEAVLRDGSLSSNARNLLEAVAEIVSHFCVRARYREARRQGDETTSLSRTLARFYAAKSLPETAAGVAESLQEELGYDRGWVCQVFRNSCRVIATSASVEPTRRRQLTKLVEQVCEASLRAGREIDWEAGAHNDEAKGPLLKLADEAGARRIKTLLVTTSDEPGPIAVVLLEAFAATRRSDERENQLQLQPHAGLSLWQAIRLHRTGLRGIVDHLTQSKRWMKYVALGGALAIGAFWLAAPTDFEIDVEGRMMPIARRSVYAPSDGVVTSLDVHHDQAVKSGDALLTLRDPKLDLEEEKLEGQLEEFRSRLGALQVLRTQGRRNTENGGDISSQEEQVNIAIRGAERQLELVREQQKRMAVTSPIAGVVDRWDMREALSSRPVVRGQHLVDVLDTAGGWELDLAIPDKLSGHILAARSPDHPLPVRYVLRTEAGHDYETTLTKIGERVELDERGRLIVRATANLSAPPDARRAGASVIARIDCGTRSRAYVWFHELWDYIQRKWLL